MRTGTSRTSPVSTTRIDTDDTEIIDDTITVTITVSDVVEKPAAPTVTVTSPFVADGASEATRHW